MRVPLDTNWGSPAPQCSRPPMACHSGVAAWAAISCPYDTCFYDVVGRSTFSSLPLVEFCWTVDGEG